MAVLPTLAVLFLTVVAVTVHGDCNVTSSNACITQAKVNMSSANSLDTYCIPESDRIMNAEMCLRACNFSTAPLDPFKLIVNTMCLDTRNTCINITGKYYLFMRAYDDYGGKQQVADVIVALFNNYSVVTEVACTNLRNARWYQRIAVGSSSATTCSYMSQVESQFYINNPRLFISMLICGIEKVPDVRVNVCNVTQVSSTIESQCSVTDSLRSATSISAVCSSLQKQVDCITSLGANCTSTLNTYLVPRFDTYAIANTVFGCKIQIAGILIRPRENACQYSDLVTTCFRSLTSLEQAQNYSLALVTKLLLMNITAAELCSALGSSYKITGTQTCVDAALKCNVPQMTQYKPTYTYDNSYQPALGTFPMNAWGLQTLWNAYGSQCVDQCASGFYSPTGYEPCNMCADGQLSQPGAFTCYMPQCDPLTPVLNGIFDNNSTDVGMTISLKCEQGYRLSNQEPVAVTMCTASLLWDPPLDQLSCIPLKVTPGASSRKMTPAATITPLNTVGVLTPQSTPSATPTIPAISPTNPNAPVSTTTPQSNPNVSVSTTTPQSSSRTTLTTKTTTTNRSPNKIDWTSGGVTLHTDFYILAILIAVVSHVQY